MQIPQRINVMPIRKTELADLFLTPGIYVQAEYNVINDWWFQDGDAPDVAIACYRLSYDGGKGDVEVPVEFFGAKFQQNCERMIRLQLEQEGA